MSNGTWISTRMPAPPEGSTLTVCDTIGGPMYTARWDGPRYGWSVMTCPRGFQPARTPAFWLSYR